MDILVDINETKTVNEALKAVLSETEQKLSVSTTQIESLNQLLADKETALTEASTKVSDLEAAISAFQTEKSALEASVAQLQAEAKTAEDRALEIVASQGGPVLEVDAKTFGTSSDKEALKAEFATIRNSREAGAFWAKHKEALLS